MLASVASCHRGLHLVRLTRPPPRATHGHRPEAKRNSTWRSLLAWRLCSPNHRIGCGACPRHSLQRSQRVLRTSANPGQVGAVALTSFPNHVRDSQPELFETFHDSDCAAEIWCLAKRTEIAPLRHLSELLCGARTKCQP